MPVCLTDADVTDGGLQTGQDAVGGLAPHGPQTPVEREPLPPPAGVNGSEFGAHKGLLSSGTIHNCVELIYLPFGSEFPALILTDKADERSALGDCDSSQLSTEAFGAPAPGVHRLTSRMHFCRANFPCVCAFALLSSPTF